jgi:hypothetical protein
VYFSRIICFDSVKDVHVRKGAENDVPQHIAFDTMGGNCYEKD